MCIRLFAVRRGGTTPLSWRWIRSWPIRWLQSTSQPVAMMFLLMCAVAGCDRGGPQNPGKTAAGDSSDSKPLFSALDSARADLARGNLAGAEATITKHLLSNPQDAESLELAGDIATATQQSAMAVGLYRSAVGHAASPGAQLFEKLGRQLMNVGDPYGAAEVLGRSIQAEPDLAKTRQDYAGLVASLGMVPEAVEHLRWLLRRGKGSMAELIMLADLGIPQTDANTCNYALKRNPRDLRPLYPLALTEAYEGRWAEAAERLKQVTETHPDFAPAWALYGRALVELEREDALQAWAESAPEESKDWIAYWMAAGLWAEKRDDPQAAVDAFWNAVQLDDTQGEALAHLAANLARIDRGDQQQLIAERGARVNAMRDSVESLFSWRKNSQEAALKIAESLRQLGRPWEAEAWARVSLSMTQQKQADARQRHQDYLKALSSKTPWELPGQSLTGRIDLADLKPFDWAELIEGASPTIQTPSDDPGMVGIHFEDRAAEIGLVHTCEIGQNESSGSIPIYKSNAGGAGVIDFDLDGWPDLYLTMVDGQPLQRDSSANRLFRNEGGRFREWPDAGAADTGFSQGVAVGDYNADGYSDLLVANIGENRLYRNNGDGSFVDVTSRVGLSGALWTTSVAMADLDGDGLAELFEVQYCAGENAYSQDCIDSKIGKPRSCSPLVFTAENDRVWKLAPNGEYRDKSDQWLIGQKPGHGLGLVVGRIDDRPGMDVYVANDMTANQFWSTVKQDTAADIPSHAFSEQAAIRGLAVNQRSQSQASMGMALGDADGDGDLDLFLTHFTDDYDTLYEQIGPGTWFDRTAAVDLETPTTKMLAFGTEWIDANNDGAPELMVANGNVDDFSHQGHPLRMLPQLFHRSVDGRWTQVERPALGGYFQKPVVGRSLVTVDINRDGLMDALVTHLFDPVAALINQSRTEFETVRLSLCGVVGGRDATGAVVTASVDGKRQVLQLTTGDGFQCSNERVVTIGLGSAKSATDVRVEWATGNDQAVGDLKAGEHYLVIEGSEEAFRFARP